MSNILTDIGTGSRGLITQETNTCKSVNTPTPHIDMNEDLSKFPNDDYIVLVLCEFYVRQHHHNYTLYKNRGFWLVYFSYIFIFRINFVHFYRCRGICMRI